ncbi:MAG: type I-C CRISPR-associated protein Cas8c/Csd1 [Burkholderiaceae bacterium]
MILQSLNELYERRQAAADPADRLPSFGFEDKAIPFVIEIDGAGALIQIRDTREPVGKKLRPRSFLVPQGVKRTVGVAANLLWDTVEYVLGVEVHAKGKEGQVRKPERLMAMREAFAERIKSLPVAVQNDAGVRAVLAFLSAPPLAALAADSAWSVLIDENPVVSFRLVGDAGLVCQRPAVLAAVVPESEGDEGMCLITGGQGALERLHTSIKGVWGAQSSGANIVSFNYPAFESFGREQGGNAPVGKQAAFAYTTALNDLLAADSPHRLQIGDSSTVVWAEHADELESAFPLLFGESADDPSHGVEAARKLLTAVNSGRLAGVDGENRFHILGLAPNAARIAIRFWQVEPLANLAPRVLRHFEDLRLARPPQAPEYLSLFRVLVSCAALGKADNIPPRLSGELVRAILAGENTPYPQALLNAAVNRCRAERDVPYPRAAAIKAWLNRQIRFTDSKEREFTPMLDLDNRNPAYRLGRLFATLEKIQEEAQPGINATIRERYYSAASSSPVAVFTTLLRLKNHHLAKLGAGRRIGFERLLSEILAAVADFPVHLNLQDQGRFALGYYHQRQAFFTKASDKE